MSLEYCSCSDEKFENTFGEDAIGVCGCGKRHLRSYRDIMCHAFGKHWREGCLLHELFARLEPLEKLGARVVLGMSDSLRPLAKQWWEKRRSDIEPDLSKEEKEQREDQILTALAGDDSRSGSSSN